MTENGQYVIIPMLIWMVFFSFFVDFKSIQNPEWSKSVPCCASSVTFHSPRQMKMRLCLCSSGVVMLSCSIIQIIARSVSSTNAALWSCCEMLRMLPKPQSGLIGIDNHSTIIYYVELTWYKPLLSLIACIPNRIGNWNVSITTYLLEAAICRSCYRLFAFWNHTLSLFNYLTKQIVSQMYCETCLTVTLDCLLVILLSICWTPFCLIN